MKRIFIDTSSLVKIYHKEIDSDKIIKTLPQLGVASTLHPV